MKEGFEYDPERALWRPGRRTFLFMLGTAVAGAFMPGAAAEDAVIQPVVTRPPMVDPRELWRATLRELDGDPSMSRELGLKLLKTPVDRQVAAIKMLREGDRLR